MSLKNVQKLAKIQNQESGVRLNAPGCGSFGLPGGQSLGPPAAAGNRRQVGTVGRIKIYIFIFKYKKQKKRVRMQCAKQFLIAKKRSRRVPRDLDKGL